MAKIASFFNFSKEEFVGYWNGRKYTFKAGERKILPEYLAWHFAKHLANRELLREGKENSTSPAKPEEVPLFMEKINMAYSVIESVDEEGKDKDETQAEVDLLNKEGQEDITGPGKEDQIVKAPDDDEDEFEEVKENNKDINSNI